MSDDRFDSLVYVGKGITLADMKAEIARLRERIEKLEAGRQADYAAGVDSGARQVIEQLNDRLQRGVRFDLLAQMIHDAPTNPFAFSLNRNMPAQEEGDK